MRQNEAMRATAMKMKQRTVFLTLAGLMIASQGQAGWLSVCEQQPAEVLTQAAPGYRTHVWTVQGQLTLLQVTPEPPRLANCQLRELTGLGSEVRWASLVPQLDASVYHLTLQGVERNGEFAVSEVMLPEPVLSPPARRPDTAEKKTPASPAAAPPRPPAAPQASKFRPGRSAWFWSPTRWRDAPQQIFSSQQEHFLKRIYITVPVEQDAVSHPAELAGFIRQAHARNLDVWAVIGDPAAVLRQGQASFSRMAAAYAAFNRSSGAKLDGMQLDVEPYLLPGYQLEPRRWQETYIDMVKHIRTAAPQLDMDVAVPFWWGEAQNGGPDFLAELAGAVNSLTVMDYRTDVAEIVRFAEPFLAWGQRHDKAVQVALEALPIADETRRHYYSAARAELWQVSLAGRDILLLLDKPASLEQARGFKFQRTSLFLGSSVSFSGRKPELMALLPQLESRFKDWTSFAGMALHGIE